MHPNYVKKGVFTSYANQQNLANPPRKENIIINDPSEQYHLKHQHQVIHNKKNLTVEELQGARFLSQSTGYSMERPEMRFQYVKGAQQQTFVPPPPQRFLVSSGQSYSQPSSLPIQSGGQIHSVHAVQPLHQSIRRTFVPHHIYNQIPVMESQTKYYHEEVHQQQENEIDESDRKMIEQYQKLYDTYQTSQIKVEQLQRLLREQREKKQSNGSEVKQVIITKEVLVEKPKKIDIKLLSSLIIKKKKAIIDEIIERKKNSCISKLRALFSEEQSNLKTTLLRVSEQFTSTRVRTR